MRDGEEEKESDGGRENDMRVSHLSICFLWSFFEFDAKYILSYLLIGQDFQPRSQSK